MDKNHSVRSFFSSSKVSVAPDIDSDKPPNKKQEETEEEKERKRKYNYHEKFMQLSIDFVAREESKDNEFKLLAICNKLCNYLTNYDTWYYQDEATHDSVSITLHVNTGKKLTLNVNKNTTATKINHDIQIFLRELSQDNDELINKISIKSNRLGKNISNISTYDIETFGDINDDFVDKIINSNLHKTPYQPQDPSVSRQFQNFLKFSIVFEIKYNKNEMNPQNAINESNLFRIVNLVYTYLTINKWCFNDDESVYITLHFNTGKNLIVTFNNTTPDKIILRGINDIVTTLSKYSNVLTNKISINSNRSGPHDISRYDIETIGYVDDDFINDLIIEEEKEEEDRKRREQEEKEKEERKRREQEEDRKRREHEQEEKEKKEQDELNKWKIRPPYHLPRFLQLHQLPQLPQLPRVVKPRVVKPPKRKSRKDKPGTVHPHDGGPGVGGRKTNKKYKDKYTSNKHKYPSNKHKYPSKRKSSKFRKMK